MRGRWEMLGNVQASHRCPEPVVAMEGDLELEEPQRRPGAERNAARGLEFALSP